MTIETYGKDQARSARRNEVGSVDSPHHANSSQNIAGAEGGSGGSERQRRIGTTFAWTDSASISLFVSGKLARQLSKSLESQLTEYVSYREKAIARTAKYDKKIIELKEELENIKQLIEQLEEAESHIDIELAEQPEVKS
jgi:hypothetical protein